MEPKECDIILDIKRPQKNEYFEVVQGDKDTNVFNIALKKDGEPYPLAGLTIEIAFSKPDGTTVVQDASLGVTVKDAINGKIHCELKTNTIAAPGRVRAEVRVLEGSKILTSTSFEFFVKKAIFGDDTIKSSNEWPLLSKLLEASNNESARIINENTRISNENTRKANETSRVTEEGKRVTRFNQMEKAYKDAMNFSANQATLEVTDARLGRKNLGELNREIMEQLDESKLATISTNSFVTPLPEVQDGVINIESIEGNTLQNIIKNGDFKQPFETPWTLLNTNNPVINNGILTVKKSVNTSIVGIYQQRIADMANLADKIYSRCEVLPPNDGKVRIGFNATATISNIVGGIWNLASGISYRNIETDKSMCFYFENIQTEVGAEIKYKNAMSINLTQIFGVGKEPTKEWCDANLSWFDGIQHLDSCVLKSTGKNLFDGEMELGGLNSGNGGENTNSNSRRSKNFIHLEVGTTYKISQDGASKAVNACFYYQNKSFLQYSSGISTITMPSNAYYVKFYYTVNSENTEKLQIEKGSAITPYEPYKESIIDITQFINTPETSLKRLPNNATVTDTLKEDGSLTRRVGVSLFTGIENWSLLSQSENVMVFNLSHPLSKPESIVFCDRFKWLTTNEWTDRTIEGIYRGVSNINIVIQKSKLTSQDIAGFKAWLSANNTTVCFELAQSTTTTIPALPTLKCSKDGTLFTESKIPAYVKFSYPTNLTSRVQTAENELDTISDSTYRLWLMVIGLADKQLQMSVIKSLTTETNADLKNKINEILNVWR